MQIFERKKKTPAINLLCGFSDDIASLRERKYNSEEKKVPGKLISVFPILVFNTFRRFRLILVCLWTGKVKKE